MTARTCYAHAFVDQFPSQLEEGIIYVSIPFATVGHLCACGCGRKVITPLGPTDWKVTFDGETISLDPSVGNWSFPCRSHYWITNNKVEWSYAWSTNRIRKLRSHEDRLRDAHYGAKGPLAEREEGDR